MRSLSSIEQSPIGWTRTQNPLPTLHHYQSPTFSLNPHSKCAFHTNQRITNFCKHPNCLLPLCPKCIKIHSEEHVQIGTLGSFEPIQQCMREAHQHFCSIFEQIAQLQKISFNIEESYKLKKQKVVIDFRKAKEDAINSLSNIFDEFEEALLIQMGKQDQQFTGKLIEYHDLLGQIMNETKQSVHKFSNRKLIMEGLITFYSQQDGTKHLEQLEQKLKNFTISKLDIKTDGKQLQTMLPIVQRYLKTPDSINTFAHLNEAHYLHNSMDKSGVENKKYEQRNYMMSDFDQFVSPLNDFSLKRSRQIRRNMRKQEKGGK